MRTEGALRLAREVEFDAAPELQSASNRVMTGFEEFAREQTATLLRAAVLLTGNQEDAEDLAQDTLVKVLARALDRLPKRERTAVVLRHYLRLDTHEVALAMGVTDSTVRSTVSRGIRSLREALRNAVDPTVRSETT